MTSKQFSNVDLSLIAITGQKIVSKKIANLENEYRLPINLPNGIYFLNIQTEGKTYAKKILVRR